MSGHQFSDQTPSTAIWSLTQRHLVADLGKDGLGQSDVGRDGLGLDLDAQVVIVGASEGALVVLLGARAAELLEDLDLV